MKHAVAKTGEVGAGQCKLVTIENKEIGIFVIDGEPRAYRNVCPHAGAPICQGYAPPQLNLPPKVYPFDAGRDPGTVRCPWHGWEFDLKDGEHVMSSLKLVSYETSVEGDDIFVEVPS